MQWLPRSGKFVNKANTDRTAVEPWTLSPHHRPSWQQTSASYNVVFTQNVQAVLIKLKRVKHT